MNTILHLIHLNLQNVKKCKWLPFYTWYTWSCKISKDISEYNFTLFKISSWLKLFGEKSLKKKCWKKKITIYNWDFYFYFYLRIVLTNTCGPLGRDLSGYGLSWPWISSWMRQCWKNNCTKKLTKYINKISLNS